MPKQLTINVKTINGQILEFLRPVIVNCNSLVPIGEDFVRVFDENDCIVVTKVFLFRHGLDVFGTNVFTTREGYYQFLSSQCCTNCPEQCCYLTYRGCRITYHGNAINV